MAEFVASLIGIAGLGAKVSITLHKIVSTLKSAQNDARLIAADISIFTCTLTQLSKTISDCNVPEAVQLFEIAQVLVPACLSLVHELQKLIGNTELYQMKGAFSMHLLALRFRWLLNGPKVTFVKSLLESFKSTLVLLISTMDLAVVMHQDAHFDVKESLKSQVRTNLHLAEDAKANLLLFQDPKPNSDPSAILDAPDSQSITSDTTSNAVTVVDPSLQSLVPYDMDAPNATQVGDPSPITVEGETDELTCLNDCSQELSGILIAQESTVKLAEDLLKIAHVPTWTWRTSAAVRPSEQQINVPIVHKDNSPNQVNESAAASPAELPNSGDKTESSQREVLIPGSQADDRATAEPLNPLQYLDKDEEIQNPPLRSPSSDNVDLQTMIKKILEETLASHKSGHASQPLTEPETTAQLQKPISPDLAVKPDVQDGTERLSKLERIMLAERDEMIRKTAIAEAERQVQKKLMDADKLEKLEGLILAQKEEQLKREEAVEAARKADRVEADAKVAKEAAEAAARAEAAAQLLEAAKRAREETEIRAAKEAADTKEAHEKALSEAKVAAEELEKAKKAAEEEAAKLKPTDAPKPPIKFKDAVGRKFSFPWHLCKTWKGMEELIKQAFLHVDVVGPHVHEGHYDLVGPDGEIVLPQVWETVVQPDWAITMHMWPMPEPPPPPKPEVPVKSQRLIAGLSKIFERRSVSQDSIRS